MQARGKSCTGLRLFERAGLHFACAHVSGDDHTLWRNHRVLQGEGCCCRIVTEQAFAVAQQQRVDQQLQFIDQARCQQLLHHLCAALGQQVGAVLLLQRTDCGGDVRA
ncbi:hypothetical protein D3C77_659240 [compost metagenome]